MEKARKNISKHLKWSNIVLLRLTLEIANTKCIWSWKFKMYYYYVSKILTCTFPSNTLWNNKSKIISSSILILFLTSYVFIDQTIYLYNGDTRERQITQGPYERKSDVIVKVKEGVSCLCVHESWILLTWIMKVFVYIACGQYNTII